MPLKKTYAQRKNWIVVKIKRKYKRMNGDKAIEWGGTTKLDTSNTCGEPNSDEEASDCAAKLLQEGKMNY